MSLLSAGDIYLMAVEMRGLSNCVLIEIASAGTLDDYGDPGIPVVEWTGSVPAYLLVEDEDILAAGTEVQVQKTTLRVFDADGAPVDELRSGADWTAASVVVEDRRNTTTRTRRWTIVGMEHESDQTLSSVTLTLNDERAA